MQRQKIEVDWRPVAAAKAGEIEIRERPASSERRRHAIDLFALIRETRLGRHERIEHAIAQRRHKVSGEPFFDAKGPEKPRQALPLG